MAVFIMEGVAKVYVPGGLIMLSGNTDFASLNEAAGLLLKIILKRDDIEIISVVRQREFQSPVVGGRNIRLDILAKDYTGKVRIDNLCYNK